MDGFSYPEPTFLLTGALIPGNMMKHVWPEASQDLTSLGLCKNSGFIKLPAFLLSQSPRHGRYRSVLARNGGRWWNAAGVTGSAFVSALDQRFRLQVIQSLFSQALQAQPREVCTRTRRASITRCRRDMEL